jgi:hypothetical protein
MIGALIGGCLLSLVLFLTGAQPFRQPLDESRLSGPQISVQADDIARREVRGEGGPKGPRLAGGARREYKLIIFVLFQSKGACCDAS